MPTVYDLTSDLQLIHEYEQFLAPRLELGSTRSPTTDDNAKLKQENAELKELLLKLLKEQTNRRPMPDP